MKDLQWQYYEIQHSTDIYREQIMQTYCHTHHFPHSLTGSVSGLRLWMLIMKLLLT